MNNQLLSYIAHLSTTPKTIHREYKKELTDRGFPCMISNDLDSSPDSLSDPMRKQILSNDRNAFFIFLLSETSIKAAVELGLALNNPKTNCCLIGEAVDNKGFPFMLSNARLVHYSNWENFIYRRFTF